MQDLIVVGQGETGGCFWHQKRQFKIWPTTGLPHSCLCPKYIFSFEDMQSTHLPAALQCELRKLSQIRSLTALIINNAQKQDRPLLVGSPLPVGLMREGWSSPPGSGY